MRVALYARVSTEDQARHGLSIEAQIAALDEWAKDKTIVDHYIDPGISARKPASKRPDLQRLLRDVEAGKIDLIAFTKLDRWTRAVKEYHKVQEILDKHHVAWRAIQEDYETETASGRFKVNLMLAIAEDEADRTSERVKAIFADKRRRGLADVGNTPIGIDYNGGHLKANSDADKVKELFEKYISTRSLRALSAMTTDILGKSYSPVGVKYILSNERYVQTGIISKQTFATVQSILETRAVRNARTGYTYLFSGLLYCPVCGMKLSCHAKNQYGRNYVYYRCDRNRKGQRCEWGGSVKEAECEAYLLDKILPALKTYNVTVKRKQKKPVNTANIKQKLDRLTDLFVEGSIDKAEYEKRAAPIRNALRESMMEPQPVNAEEIVSTKDLYPMLSRQGKRAFWSRLIKRITPTEDGFDFEFFIPYVIKSHDFLAYREWDEIQT